MLLLRFLGYPAGVAKLREILSGTRGVQSSLQLILYCVFGVVSCSKPLGMARPDAGGIAGTGGVAGAADSNSSGGVGSGGTQVTGTTTGNVGSGGATFTTGTGGGMGGATMPTCPVGDAGIEMPVDTRTDNSHCGGCGNTCTALPPSTAQCTAGRCLVMLAKWQWASYSLALDQSNVYWANAAGEYVEKVPKAGGDPVVLAHGQVRSVVADATSIYWTAPGKPNPSFVAGTVMKMPIGGGVATTLATGESPWNIAVDKAGVYWIDRGQLDVLRGYQQGSVMKVALEGGAPTKLASIGYLPDSDVLKGDGTGTIAVDATSVYWTDTDNDFDSVRKVPLGGGTVKTLAQGSYGSGRSIAVDASSVYWTTSARAAGDWRDGTVMKVPIEGGSPTVLASAQATPRSIAVDSTSVYWTTAATPAGGYADGGVMKAPREGGLATTLVSGQPDPCGIAVDATSVYWLDSEGSVMRAYPK
jgi:hypothetical protein